MNFEIIKKHPYASAGAGVVIFILVYYLASKGSTSQAASQSAGGVYGFNANDLAYLQIQAAQTSQANQIAGQVQVAGINAGVAADQVAGQVQLGEDSLAAQLASIQSQSATQIAVTQANDTAQVQINAQNTTAQTSQVQAQAQENIAQTQALADIFTTQSNNQVQGQQNQLDYLAQVAADQTAVAMQGQNDQASVIENAQNNAYQLSSSTISQLTANNGLSRNNTQLSEVLASIDAALGQPSVGTAQAGAGANIAGASAASTASIFSSFSNLGAALFAGA